MSIWSYLARSKIETGAAARNRTSLPMGHSIWLSSEYGAPIVRLNSSKLTDRGNNLMHPCVQSHCWKATFLITISIHVPHNIILFIFRVKHECTRGDSSGIYIIVVSTKFLRVIYYDLNISSSSFVDTATFQHIGVNSLRRRNWWGHGFYTNRASSHRV